MASKFFFEALSLLECTQQEVKEMLQFYLEDPETNWIAPAPVATARQIFFLAQLSDCDELYKKTGSKETANDLFQKIKSQIHDKDFQENNPNKKNATTIAQLTRQFMGLTPQDEIDEKSFYETLGHIEFQAKLFAHNQPLLTMQWFNLLSWALHESVTTGGDSGLKLLMADR
jgi:hypothetical protein